MFMVEFKSTELAAILERKTAKVKRHARELFGHDRLAGQGKGYARKFTLDECFKIFLYGLMIEDTNLSTPEIKDAIDASLLPWMEKKGLYPISGKNFNQSGHHPSIQDWHITIRRLFDDRLHFEAEGLIESTVGSEEIDGQSRVVRRVRYVKEDFRDPSIDPAGESPDNGRVHGKIVGGLSMSEIVSDFINKMEAAEYKI